MDSTQIWQTAEKLFRKAEQAQTQQKYQKSIDLGEKAVALFQQLEEEEKVIEVKLLNCQNYVTLGRMEETFTSLKSLERDCKEKLGDSHELTIALLHQLTFFYIIVLKKMQEGIDYAHKCLKIHLSMEEKDASRMSLSYNNLGFAYGEIGDYDQQLLYYQKTLSNTLETVGDEHEDVGRAYNNLGYYYQTIAEDYSKAIEYHQKGIYINKKFFGEQSYMVALGYSNMGYIHLHIQDFDKAVEYYKKSLSILEEIIGRNHVYATVKSGLGETYERLGWLTQSIEEYAIALQVWDTILIGKHPQRAKVLNSWSRALRKLGEYELALKKNHLALLEMLKMDETDMGFLQLSYQIEDFKTIRPLLLIFVEKARICLAYFYEKPTEYQYLQLCLETCLLASRYIKNQRTGYHTSGTKMALNKSAMTVYELGLQTAVKIANQAKGRQLAFDFSEQTKANLLLDSIHDSIVKEGTVLPKVLLQQEKDLKLELTRLEKSIQLQESLGKRKDEDYIQKLQNQFFDCHKRYLQLVEKFEKEYPDYYQLKYQTETVSVEMIQQTLSANQWMVSYFIGEMHFYIFFMGKDVFEVMEYEKSKGFEQLVNDFLQSIQQHQLEEYEHKAYELYQRLLQPVEVYLMDMLADESELDEVPQLIVIPHDILNYVPFEALVCTRPGKHYDKAMSDLERSKAYQSLDYLLLHCEVTYHYSATLWHYLNQQQRKGERADTEDGFVGFAPVYETEIRRSQKRERGGEKSEKGIEEVLKEVGKEVAQWATRSEALRSDGSWTALPHSKTEAQNIASLFQKKGLKAQTFLHEQATKERLREVVEQSRFLLIAAHGVVNDERPKLSGLVFFPEKREERSKKRDVEEVDFNLASRFSTPTSQIDCILSMEETYHLNLQKTDLVVLSSCESGIGQLAKGEGMMAVNRGFLYAGAKNVVSTLFKVYDKPSSLLTQYLFEGVLVGKGYGESLRLAKLRLLQLKEVDVKSWSGFVLIGGS